MVCHDHPDGSVQMVETGYTRVWSVTVDGDGKVTAYGDRIDLESGAGDERFECSTCLADLTPEGFDWLGLDYL